MALVQNNKTQYADVKPEFDSVKSNDDFEPPEVSKRELRGMKAANGGDISQLGMNRLVLDKRMQLIIATKSCAYFQPHEFDYGDPRVIAAKITYETEPVAKWTPEIVQSVQKELLPSEDLTAAEVERILTDTLADIEDELTIYGATIASFINNNAEGNNTLKGVILSVDTIDRVDDGRTIGAGATNEQVTALSGAEVQALGVEHLTTVAQQVKGSDPVATKAISALLGAAYYGVSKKLAVAFEPFSTAVEMARVARVNTVSDVVVDDAINLSGLVAGDIAAGRIKRKAIVEVVYAADLALDLLCDLTDKEFSNAELKMLEDYDDANVSDAGSNTDPVLLSALNKRRTAVAAPGVDWIAHVNGGNDDKATEEMYDSVGTWRVDTVDEVDYLGVLAKYALAAPTTRIVLTAGAPAVALADMATARMNIINHELHGECCEVVKYSGEVWGALSIPKSTVLFDAVSSDIVGQLQHATAHISFMKSGHHATANNVANTLSKLCDAIGQENDASDLPERLAYGTYFGTKPADQRAVALFLRAKYARNELSFAIGRRITPHGPGTVSMFLLDMVMDQLHDVNFFKYLDRMEQYTHFKGVFTQYAKTAHLEVPYARFFYGGAKSESVSMKQSVAPMFAYAAAIGIAMPTSTIGNSVALAREAAASNSNSMTAKLEVESFVKAYRNFLRAVIRKRLEEKSGIKVGTQLIENDD